MSVRESYYTAMPNDLESPQPASDSSTANNWLVYIIKCSDNSLYTGITTDLARRWKQHCGELKNGAKFFRGRKPQRLAFVETEHCRSSALKREYQIKQLSRSEKLTLINTTDLPQHDFTT